MEAVRKIIDAERLSSIINLPESMLNTKVEIIVQPVSESKLSDYNKTMKGFLKQYANPDLIEQENGAWERAAVEKHGGI